MSAVSELLGYNRFGLPYLTPRHMRELRRRVSRHDWADVEPKKPSLISRIALHLARTLQKNDEEKLRKIAHS